MSLPGIEAVVRDRLGLDPEALGAAALPLAVEKRTNAIGVATTDAYLEVLSSNPAEQIALAAELAVAETWFFRGGYELFDTLAVFVSERAGQRPAETPVRVLSVPCSTGEEPYSLAIALDRHQVPPSAYQIEGVDLSVAHLTRAASGRFNSFSFRDSGPELRTTYFQQTGDRWELRPAIRERVRFSAGNVADPNFHAGVQLFDVILCRNLFIYLTEDARRRALANLDRLLAKAGRLVLSPAEADRLPPNRFVGTGPPSLGIYQRTGLSDTTRPAIVVGPPERKPVSHPAAIAPQRVARAGGTTPIVRAESIAAHDTLEAARVLADAGQLVAARSVCERMLARAASDPNVYSLLGVVNLAEGRPADAADSFRKALYLDPDHQDALGHMIVICDNRGDIAQAAALRKRLARTVREEPA
jgi:chemotaxis protein methyltransferase WspC